MLRRTVSIAALLGMVFCTSGLDAKDRKTKDAPSPPHDTIEVVSHVALTGASITRFMDTKHYSSDYLYAVHGQDGGITLLDVTDVGKPSILADMPSSSGAGSENLLVVTGTAALVNAQPNVSIPAAASQTVKIMDFSDPKNPVVAREFVGVTAVGRNDARGLIFLANAEGVWILRQHFALDPAVEKAYEDYVNYTR